MNQFIFMLPLRGWSGQVQLLIKEDGKESPQYAADTETNDATIRTGHTNAEGYSYPQGYQGYPPGLKTYSAFSVAGVTVGEPLS